MSNNRLKKRKLEKLKDALDPEKAAAFNLSRIVDRIDLIEGNQTSNQEAINASFAKIIELIDSKKSFEISNLKEYPQEIRVNNLSEIPKFPKIPEYPKEIAISNLKENNNPDHKPKWIDATLISFLDGLGYLLGKVTSRVFKISPTADSYMTPQRVVLIDPKTGLETSPTSHVHVGAMGGGGSGLANQAIVDTLENYKISDGDESGTTKYYGYLTKTGSWYIMQNNTTANTYRYTKGSTSYTTSWTNRSSLTYGYFNTVFNN